MNYILRVCTILCLLLAIACSDSSDNQPRKSEAQRLLEQFGELQPYFTEEGVQGLLDYEDTGRPVTLVQLMSVTDGETFARYEQEAAALWESIGAGARFHSEMFDQLVGDRSLNQTRAIEFPSIMVLLAAIDTPAFTDLMNTLAAASDDHAWVLGEEEMLPLEPGGSYFDPALQNLDHTEAAALLAGSGGAGSDGEPGFESNPAAIVDMVVSDAPSPFWMVNLIDFYEEANFPDGRDSDLSGKEANEIYGNAILPTLLRYNSLPDLLMSVALTLTVDEVEWEQAAFVRYASRDAFLNAFPLNPQADEALVFKQAGVENTLVYASEVPGTVLAAPATGPLFNFRYCEVLLFYPGAVLRADVYNSMPLGNCPQDLWDALDAQQIAGDYGAFFAGLNGIRFWVLDLIESQVAPGPPIIEDFGGIPMRLAASVEVAMGAETGEAAPYQVNRVSRNTVFHYVAGRQVYELQDPQGNRYRMQSFTRGNDPDQQLVDLQRLGQRLELPDGWSFHVILLDEDAELPSVDGIAEVITDELGNTYQRIP